MTWTGAGFQGDFTASVIVEQNLELLLSVAAAVLVMDHGHVFLDQSTCGVSRNELEEYLMV